jgi:hypothetical protein
VLSHVNHMKRAQRARDNIPVRKVLNYTIHFQDRYEFTYSISSQLSSGLTPYRLSEINLDTTLTLTEM